MSEEYKTLEDKIFEGYVTTFTHIKNDGTIETLYTEKYVDEIESKNEKLQQRIDKAIEYIKEHTLIDYYGMPCFNNTNHINELLEILGEKENE